MTTRRRFLHGVAASSAAGLAGCSTDPRDVYRSNDSSDQAVFDPEPRNVEVRREIRSLYAAGVRALNAGHDERELAREQWERESYTMSAGSYAHAGERYLSAELAFEEALELAADLEDGAVAKDISEDAHTAATLYIEATETGAAMATAAADGDEDLAANHHEEFLERVEAADDQSVSHPEVMSNVLNV